MKKKAWIPFEASIPLGAQNEYHYVVASTNTDC